MKKGASHPSVRAGYLVALAVTILTTGLVHAGQYFSAKQLRTTAGFSIPVDVNASSFGCKSPGSWSDTVWCSAYGSTYESHVAEANRHAGIIVMYKNSYDGGAFGVPNYGDFYTTGNYGSSAGGFDKDSVVHCPSGATMQYHTSSHHKYSPSLGRGFYDSDGGEYHYWCESGGVAINPIKGAANGTMPDYWSTDKDWLVKYQFPNGLVKYKRGNDTGGWYKCQNSYAGPFEPGVNQYLNSYHITAANKKPYYRCLSADGASYVNSVDDFDPLPAPYYGVWTIVFGLNNAINCSSDFKTCQPSCAAGDSTCGGAGTYGASTQKCASNTYWCQTTDPNTRYCSATAVCATSNFTPPAPTWALANPTGVGLNPSYHTAGSGGNYVIETDDSIYMTANVSLTGTGQPSTPNKVYRFKISNSQTDFSNPRWNSGLLTSATSASTIAVITPASGLGAGGPWYVCVEVAMNNDNSTVTLFDSASQKTACTVSSTSFTTIAPVVTTACNNNGVCNSGESSGSCPADCGNTTTCPTSMPYRCTDNSCAVSSTSCPSTTTCPTSTPYRCTDNSCAVSSTSCPSTTTCPTSTPYRCTDNSCAVSATSCPNTTTCPTGQNWDSARSMCISSDWQEIIWNNLGLRSYVSINAPQSVIDAAKVACANTQPSQVSWPNPSDFTRPATAGIPDCSGTQSTSCDNDRVCESGETMASCPTDCGNNPVPITGPKGCAVGETCSVSNGDWCSNGRQCFGYASGGYTGTFGCYNWSDACPSSSKTCPANDPNCIEPGSFGSATGNCRDAMECYAKDGSNRKYCNPYSPSTTGASSMVCPASVDGVALGSCSANSPDCVEPGATRNTNLTSAWCTGGSVSCYSADETTLFCQPMTGSQTTMMSISCPTQYPNKCRPGDRYCTEAGETNTESGAYCMNGGNECWSSGGGLYCPAAGESCPTGSGACRAGSTGCIEPGSEGSATNGYCGGRSISCYKTDGRTMTCQAITNPSDPFSWEKTICPVGTSRCRADDQFCCELGETCSSSSWCTSGYRKENSDRTITCLSSDNVGDDDQVIIDDEDERVCIQVITMAYNPTTLECKNFATPCNVPDGWKYSENGEVCVNGKLGQIDRVIEGDDLATMTKMYQETSRYLQNLDLQLRSMVLVSSDLDILKELVKQGFEELAEIKKLLPPKSKKDMDELKEQFGNFYSKTMVEIDTKFASIKPYMSLFNLRMELGQFIATLNIELSQIDPETEYFTELSAEVKKLEGLLHQAEMEITNSDALNHILVVIQEEKAKVEELLRTHHQAQKGEFVGEFVTRNRALVTTFGDFVRTKAVEDSKIAYMLTYFGEKVAALEQLYTANEDYYKILRLVDEVDELRIRLEKWLAPYGYRVSKQATIAQILTYVDKIVQERVDQLFKDMTVVLDEAVQEAVIKFAEIASEFSDQAAEKVVTSVNNIISVATEEIRNEIAAAKNEILDRVSALQQAIDDSDLAYFNAQRLRELMDYTSTINWCGDIYENVQADLNSVGLAFENDETDGVDIDTLESDIHDYAEDNIDECYSIGAANFLIPMHEWYFPYAEYNYSHGYMTGYKDDSGNRTGEFGAADSTLRIEALTMAMRLFGVSIGNDTDPGRDDVPPWAYSYYNGAVKNGINFDWAWNQPITRVESAKLLLKVMLALDEEYVTVPTGDYTAINKYPDRGDFASDPEYAQAVEVWTDLEVFQGAGDSGNFNPNNHLLRSEFATLVQRIDETLGLNEEAVN